MKVSFKVFPDSIIMNEDYSQPEFYRFNQDSLLLVKIVLEKIKTAQSILDLGSGCGIIGIEVARSLLPQKLTLLELQPEYLEHLEKNLKKFLPAVASEIILKSFGAFNPNEKFDLILCNPPYYLPGKGELAQNPNRRLARSFLTDSWDILLNKIDSLLSQTGRAFIVLKKDETLFASLLKQRKNLEILRVDYGSNMILELFRLDKNGDKGSF